MNQKHSKWSWMTILMVAGMASVSMAQDLPDAARSAGSGRGAFGFVSILEHKVGLTPEQLDTVRGLLAAQRQKSQAMREETDGKIRALLNPEQQTKFDDVLADQKARYARGRSRPRRKNSVLLSSPSLAGVRPSSWIPASGPGDGIVISVFIVKSNHGRHF